MGAQAYSAGGIERSLQAGLFWRSKANTLRERVQTVAATSLYVHSRLEAYL